MNHELDYLDEYWPSEKRTITSRIHDWWYGVKWWWKEYWPAVAAGTLCGWSLELMFYILLYKS